VRKTLLLPLIFLLIFIGLLVVSGTFIALYGWSITYTPTDNTTDPDGSRVSFIADIPAGMQAALPAIAVAAVFLCFPGIRKAPGMRFFSLFVVAAAAFFVIIFSFLLTKNTQSLSS